MSPWGRFFFVYVKSEVKTNHPLLKKSFKIKDLYLKFPILLHYVSESGCGVYLSAVKSTDACRAEQRTVFPSGSSFLRAFVAVLQCVGSAKTSWRG